MSDRYGFQTGYYHSTEMTQTMSGPQREDQVPSAVRKLLSDSIAPIKFVMVIYKGPTGADKIDCYNKIKSE